MRTDVVIKNNNISISCNEKNTQDSQANSQRMMKTNKHSFTNESVYI